MSNFGKHKPTKLSKLQRFEYKLTIPFELYFDFGSTFFLKPEITMNETELFVFDWLYIHIGIRRVFK